METAAAPNFGRVATWGIMGGFYGMIDGLATSLTAKLPSSRDLAQVSFLLGILDIIVGVGDLIDWYTACY